MALPGITAINQDFILYAGDTAAPTFTVKDQAGAIVDISAVQNITWAMSRAYGATDTLAKSKTDGSITFVTDGTDGQFEVEIDPEDTARLTGLFVHIAKLVDVLGDVTTVSLGAVTVGPKAPVEETDAEQGIAAVQQDFILYSGDDALPTFTVVDRNGDTIDISGVQDISWTVSRSFGTTAVITKTKVDGGISFVTDGTDGRFQIAIVPADTAALTAFYFHIAKIVDGFGYTTTVATGQLQVGPKPVASYSGDPTASARDMARTLVGDIDMDAPLFYDTTYDGLAATFGGPLYVAAQICRMLAQKYAARSSKRVGDFSISTGEVSRNYLAMAADFQMRADSSGAMIYAAGTSKSDGQTYRDNSDARRAFTTLDQFDNNGAIGGFFPPNGGGN